jgi:hypothetical protein
MVTLHSKFNRYNLENRVHIDFFSSIGSRILSQVNPSTTKRSREQLMVDPTVKSVIDKLLDFGLRLKELLNPNIGKSKLG